MTETDKTRGDDRAGMTAKPAMARSMRKFAAMLAVVGACLAVLHFSPAREMLSDIDTFKAQLRETGAFAPLVFFASSALLTMAGFPRLALTFAAGVLFGVKAGLPLALVSTLAGSYATFCIARWCGRDWALRMAGKSKRMDFLMSNQSISTVFLSRQLPAANVLINLMLSLTRIGHGTFLLGSLLGFIPAALVATLSGSSLGKTSPLISFFQFLLAAIIVAVSAITVFRLKRKWRVDYAGQHS